MSTIDTNPKKIDELLTRGVEEVIVYNELREKLLSGKQLRVKLGIDPTSPHLHLGRAVQLLKLRDFQQLGHQVVLIIGDFTAVIGDTSDKDSERPMLTEEVIAENKKTYFEQVGKLIDLDKAELHYNSEWLVSLTYKEIGEQANQFSVADFIARENIKKRLDTGKRVSLREVLYPLMQGYDSVAIRADVELGGTDQRFNVLAGRPLQEYYGQAPQSIVTGPLIAGTDGRKMSSSWGNAINLNDEPSDMYGKVMSMTDDLLPQYFEVCTRIPMEDVAKIRSSLDNNTLHPKDAKMCLAREIVTLYHGSAAAQKAEEEFITTFSEGGVPDDIPVYTAGKGTLLLEILVLSGIAPSKSEARRLFEGGAVHRVDQPGAITDLATEVIEPMTLKIGKRRFLKIELA